MTARLTERLEKCYSGAVHDVMREMGLRDFVLPPSIRPLIPERKLCGPAFTVRGRVDTSADAHHTLVEWTGLLSKAKAGTVIVCRPNDSTVAHMGELSAETLQLRGIRGYIVDGGCRDADFILNIGFPVWCRYFTPRDVLAYWLPDATEIPITIGDVMIKNGDYVLADRDGVVVVP
jgi:4-hydroxy-4-methyl-2-oxoglutarate aldolase